MISPNTRPEPTAKIELTHGKLRLLRAALSFAARRSEEFVTATGDYLDYPAPVVEDLAAQLSGHLAFAWAAQTGTPDQGEQMMVPPD